MSQVSYGTITITDTNDIERIYMEYAQSTSNSVAPTSGWSENIPTWKQGYYIWQRTVTKMQGVSLTNDSYGDPVCLTGSTGSQGPQGTQGPQGNTGVGVSSITTTYCNYGTGTPADTYSGWQTTVPAYDSSKPNYWVKTVVNYNDGTSSIPVIYKDNGITSATSTAAAANQTAGQANQTANQANETANQANTTAGNALSVANSANDAISDLNQYFWRQKIAATNVPAGSYVTNVPGTTYKSNPANGGFNSLVQSTGIFLRNGITTLSSWTGSALTFYQPGTSNKGIELTSSALKFYDSTGTTAQATFGGTQATISGTINVYDGKIGNSEDSYWYIGNYLDYNQNNSAAIKSHGTAFIQLGDSSTWRVATNRIHSAWNDDNSSGNAFRLHFPVYDDKNSVAKHWDVGMHLPLARTDKFLYIRNADSSQTLENLGNDLEDSGYNYWTYQFWVDGEGNVHAPGFYIGNSTTPIGGGAGTVAERLTQGYGSATQPVYFNSNGVPTNTTYKLNAAGAKGVDTSISASSTSTNLPTSQAVAAFVEGKGYITSYVDEKVKTSQENAKKIYLAGTQTSGTSTGTLNYDSNVYLTTTAGTLHATTFEGNLSGTASRATADADGNTIKTTYLKLSGGQVTGPVSFGDSVTVEDLVVNGDASFANNISANTINGVSVGSNPKFTDNNTTYTFASGTNGFTVTPSGGSAQTVTVTPSISNNVTGSGTNGSLVKWTGTNTVGNGPALGSDTTKFLNNKGEWAVPAGTYTYTLPLAANGTRGGVQIGYTQSGKNYPVQLSSEKMYVNVPWENTTYESKTAASGGTDVSLVTTGEKYTWNQKTSNTGTVTSVATSSPITGGTITGSGTIGHATSGVGSATTTAGLYKFKYDTYGHVTGVTAIAKADITGLGIPSQDTTYSNASTTTAGLMSAADKKKLDNIQVDSSGQAVAANVAGRWGIDVTFSDTNVAQVGHANTAVTASNTQASTVSSATTKTALSFGSIVKLPYVSYDTYGHVTGKSEVYFQLPAAPSSTTSATNATNDSDGNPINTTYIKKSIGTAAGDIIYWSASGTPVRLAKGSNGQVLKLANGVPTWGADNNDNTNYYHTTGSWSGLTYTATANGGAGALAFTLPTASASASGVINTDAQVIYGKKTLKNTTRIYPRIGASAERSQWYKITFPYSTAETTNAAKWFMNSFDLHFGGGYSSNANGVAHVAFYWTRAANNGVWAASQVSAKLDGVLMNKISLYYRIAEPGVLYVNNSSNNYNGLWLDNLFVDDSSPALDWSTTTITSCSSITIGDYIEVPTVRTYNNDNSTYIIGNHTLPMSDNTYNLGSSDLKWRNVYATTFNGNASTASKITNITSADTASSSENWRKVWISYSDGVTGRPAVTDGLTFQTSTNTLKATTFEGNLNGNAINVTGIVAITNGGTGASTAAGARANLNTWSIVSDSYNTLMPSDGVTNGWIKIGTSNTTYGLLPSAAGGAGSGHNYIGTSTWYWKYAYIDSIYGYLNGNISGSAASATSATYANYIKCPDTRNVVLNPSDLSAYDMGIRFDFKYKDTIGLTDATYSGVMSFRPYSSTTDWSGGPAHQLAFNEAGLYRRTGTTNWNSWYKILDSNNYTNYMGNYVTINTAQTITASQKTFNGAIRWGDASNPSKYGAAHYDSTLEAIVFSFA